MHPRERKSGPKLTDVLLGVHHAQLAGQGAKIDQEVEVPGERKFQNISDEVRTINGREMSELEAFRENLPRFRARQGRIAPAEGIGDSHVE